MQIAVTPTNGTQLAALWRQAPDITREELLRTITECDLLTQDELMQKLPKGAGGLHGAGIVGSLFTEEQPLADNVIGLVASNRPEAEYLETGTRPHAVGKAGIRSIMDWVEARIGLHDEEAEGMAYGIGWKIFHHGTAAQPVWQETYVRLQGEYRAEFEACAQRITERLVGQPA
ncbi:MAG: hypothetical protein AB1832_01190 [Pseudomonadota bacterium]